MEVAFPAGTGKVVDGACRVVGIQRLRVVDTSVIPFPLGTHYQTTIYAMAEKLYATAQYIISLTVGLVVRPMQSYSLVLEFCGEGRG
jgi:hypothetical protein